MSIMAPIALLIIPGRRDPSLCVPSQGFLKKICIFFKSLALWLVKPFETVTVIKGYTNKIDLTWTCYIYTAGENDMFRVIMVDHD